jgi:hypothetical protein
LSNNLFWSLTGVLVKPVNSNLWAAYNNLFDSCVFGLGTSAVTNSGNNAYYNCTKQLNPTNASDITLSNAVSYASGPLGRFYQLTNSPLIDMGSCTADLAGLSDYTVTTNIVSGAQIREGNGTLDIGLHYVALDANGIPLDLNSDGMPDYWTAADSDGDGVNDFLELLQGRNPQVAGSVSDTNGVVNLRIYTPLK